MTKKTKAEASTKAETIEKALDKLIDKAKTENTALKKILEGIDKIHKKELEQKLNNKTKQK